MAVCAEARRVVMGGSSVRAEMGSVSADVRDVRTVGVSAPLFGVVAGYAEVAEGLWWATRGVGERAKRAMARGAATSGAYAGAMRERLRVGIVGCGTGGQAAALLLHRAGHEVVVHERSVALEPVGAGLLLQPTGVAVLRELGAAETLGELAKPIERLHGVNECGRDVLDVRYADLACGGARGGAGDGAGGSGADARERAVGWGVHRGALFATLLGLMRANGIEIRTGEACAKYAVQRDGRAALMDERGAALGVYDLLIVADGARSALRASFPFVGRATRYPWGAFWCVANDPDGNFGNTLYQVYRGTRGMIGFLPSGKRAAGEAATVSVFWSVRCSEMDAVRAEGLEAFQRNVRTLTDKAEPVLAQIADLGQVISAAYHDVVLSRPNHGPVVFIGDAAHAMSPQLGQGANLALLDASVLARVLGESAGAVGAHARNSAENTAETVARALERYGALRRSHTAYYQFVSRWLTPMFQSDYEWLSVPRDALMGPCCGVPLFRRLMLETLVGARTGLMPWSRRLEIPTCARDGSGRSRS